MSRRAPAKPIPNPNRDECLVMARQCLSASLRRTERLVTRHYDAYLEKAGVTAVQLPMLAMIAAATDPTFRLLTDQLELDRSTLSRNLGLLSRLGLVDIGPSSGPKPGLIKLTRRGKDVLRRAHVQWLRAHHDLMELLDPEAVTEGIGFLKHLRSGARKSPGART
jgi:DNA-binding MarR family transcriptional regulator